MELIEGGSLLTVCLGRGFFWVFPFLRSTWFLSFTLLSTPSTSSKISALWQDHHTEVVAIFDDDTLNSEDSQVELPQGTVTSAFVSVLPRPVSPRQFLVFCDHPHSWSFLLAFNFKF
jgi:hypothetical protein